VAHNAVFSPFVQVMWKRLYDRMVRRVIPPLDQHTVGVMLVMAVLGHLKGSTHI
jgi:hypothetical protein